MKLFCKNVAPPHPKTNKKVLIINNNNMNDSYINCIKKVFENNLGREFLDLTDERAFSKVMKPDAMRLVDKFGISMQDAAVVAVVNFRQDIKIHMLKTRPEVGLQQN